MDLDTTTLRVAFATAALTMLALFYFVTYRSTRSGYSGWWSVALAWFLVGSAAFILNGTEHQRWANPSGNTFLVLGAASAWAATRSLTGSKTPAWLLLFAPTVTAIASFADDPVHNVWTGGPVFLAMMSLMFGLSARELWRIDRELTHIRTSVATAATCICAFYAARWVVFMVDGQDGDVFKSVFGSQVTTIVSLIFLVVVSFSMSILSNEEATKALRAQAGHDGLTGLLNRSEFLRLAAAELHETSAALILADLDHFKAVNDTYGHPAGDRALRAFADACSGTVRTSDLVGRYGGEEFIVLLPNTHLDRAEAITAQISEQLRLAEAGFPMPTASYGITIARPGIDLETSIATADAALYLAKQQGRNRAVRA
ncbi:diguanylate cyclase (GGDEF)-like protein [Aeromicrobium panaciterrae]|uniref:Diguanylate cyclase (GGDEF)-like protein n=1 Tax=Aeromicrobium panaciterrae TaxID=363861 RepID=A0ABU1UKS4_9ACTN|nr:GGDEF domain-containing protein [Aeromicrobium panaciterrae]MDR7085779.1 diguanylate cyclase (GGDEF)-like protein [Aeromicrobium panaciterrae]